MTWILLVHVLMGNRKPKVSLVGAVTQTIQIKRDNSTLFCPPAVFLPNRPAIHLPRLSCNHIRHNHHNANALALQASFTREG